MSFVPVQMKLRSLLYEIIQAHDLILIWNQIKLPQKLSVKCSLPETGKEEDRKGKP